MGFDTNVVLLKPEEYGPHKIWYPTKVLNIGRISSRLNDPEYAKKNARGRAALHFMECVFNDLTTYVNAAGNRALAPRFSLEESKTDILIKLKRCRQLIVPYKSVTGQQIPDRNAVHEHNRAHRPRNGHADKTDIVFVHPLVWVACPQISAWIEKREAEDFPGRVRQDDADAAHHLEAWKSALAQETAGKCKALFLFESIDDPLII